MVIAATPILLSMPDPFLNIFRLTICVQMTMAAVSLSFVMWVVIRGLQAGWCQMGFTSLIVCSCSLKWQKKRGWMTGAVWVIVKSGFG